MRKNFTVLIFLAIVNICGCSTKNEHQITTLDKVFRKITLDDGKTMSLGQDITEIKDLCIKNDEGYSLKPGTFIRADSFALYVTEENKIHTIHTYYDADRSFSETVEVYRNFLDLESTSKNYDSIKVEYWQDNESVFAIVELHKDQGNVVFATLCDRKLYEDNLSGFNNHLVTMKVSEDLTTSINIMNFILNQ